MGKKGIHKKKKKSFSYSHVAKTHRKREICSKRKEQSHNLMKTHSVGLHSVRSSAAPLMRHVVCFFFGGNIKKPPLPPPPSLNLWP